MESWVAEGEGVRGMGMEGKGRDCFGVDFLGGMSGYF